jgi:alkaline phosphatase
MQYRNKGFVSSALVLAGILVAATAQAAPPKVVILMIGDGMGFNQVLAADYYQHGESGRQPHESPEFVRLAVSTYPAGGSYDPQAAWSDPNYINKGCTDSAAAATALSTGVKTKNGQLGLGPNGERLETMTDFMHAHGRAVGVVTTVPITHATPAGFVAHQMSRGRYTEIAREMLLESPVRVVMGGGHPDFDDDGKPSTEPDEADRYQYVGGKDTWEMLHDPAKSGWKVIQEPAEFKSLAEKAAGNERILGVMRSYSTSQVARAGHDDNIRDDAPYETPRRTDVPTLADMSRGAINVLKGGDGFFLMIEGGAIDWSGHKQAYGRMVEEMVDFNDAVAAVIDWVNREGNWDNTLLVITADHETGRLSGPEGAREVENAGRGVLPKGGYTAKGHTNSLVPLFARGQGTDILKKYADEQDPVRGPYLDNTEVAKSIRDLWN